MASLTRGVRGRLLQDTVLPVGDLLFRSHLRKYLRSLDDSQWWPRERLQLLQDAKLRRLVMHAARNVPYYRQLFSGVGLEPEELRTRADLTGLPILTKDIVRARYHDLVAESGQCPRNFEARTGGSTGQPLLYLLDRDSWSIGWAANYRGWSFAGFTLGAKRATLAGSSLLTRDIPLIVRVRNALERNLPLSTLDLTHRQMREYVKRLDEWKPSFVRGYASALQVFSEYLMGTGHPLLWKPVAIFTTGETLTAGARQVIEHAFSAPVFDHYGCHDGGVEAHECEYHEGYHVAMERALVEYVPLDNGDSEGLHRIVVTDLHNYSMPFIRYDTGDVCRPAVRQCKCGRGLELIESLEGRRLDFLVLPDGRRVRGLRIVDLFYEHAGNPEAGPLASITDFRVEQTVPDRLMVQVVQTAPPSADECERIVQALREACEYPIAVDLRFVPQIDRPSSGKRRFVVSSVKEQDGCL